MTEAQLWPGLLSSVFRCAQNEAKQQWDIKKSEIQTARHKRNIHDIHPDKVEECDTMNQNARHKLEHPVGPAMPCVTRERIPTAKTQRQKVAVSNVGLVVTLSIDRRATHSDKKRRANKSDRVPKLKSFA